MLPGSPLQLRIIFDANRFEHPQIRNMLEQLHHCLLSLSSVAHRPIDTVQILPQSQVDRMMQASVDCGERFSFETAVHDRILSLSQCDDIALSGAHGDISYRQLNRFTDELAARLSELMSAAAQSGGGRREEQIVAIHLSRDQPVIESMIAVLKSGAGYVVIDPQYPHERIQHLIHRFQPVGMHHP